MALSQRPASRFFAAFYRWTQHAQQTRRCAISTAHAHHNPANHHARTRCYHATRLLRQHDEPPHQGGETVGGVENGLEQGPKIRKHGMKKADVHATIKRMNLKHTVRDLMRKVPSSVAIVTVASFDHELQRNVPMGVAVSSLSTVSMDPPTISFNVKHPSKTLDAIRAAKGMFRVHFPAAVKHGADMVELFCRGNHADAYEARKQKLRIFIPGVNADNNQRQATDSRAPQLFDKSVRAAMECTLTHEFQVGDHVIIAASIDSIESKSSDVQTVLYVDGKYLAPDGKELATHETPSTVSVEAWSPWDYPLFPGDVERQDFVSRLRSTIEKRPELHKIETSTFRELNLLYGVNPGTFGIELEQLVKEVAGLKKMPSGERPEVFMPSCLSDFYGRLTPSDRAKLYERAENLVREDDQFLTSNYLAFLKYLRVSIAVKDLLPSDILGALREAGLAAPFQPSQSTAGQAKQEYNLEYLEQVEHRLITHLSTLEYERARKIPFQEAVEAVDEHRDAAVYFKHAHGRLLTAAFPLLFQPPNVDISGHLSRDEACVVMSRIMDFWHLGAERKIKVTDIAETLRLVGVHPLITGFDIDFFYEKLAHIYFRTRYSKDVPARVKEMLKGWFADTVTWSQLEEKVKTLVQKSPTRAMTWSRTDKLAAMGLSWDAVLEVPISVEKPQPLNRGPVLETLIAKELKTMYGKSADDKAIAKFLKERYAFDVTATKKLQQAPSDLSLSSSDEMQQARLASRNVDVPLRKTGVELKPRIRGFEENVHVAPRFYKAKDTESKIRRPLEGLMEGRNE